MELLIQCRRGTLRGTCSCVDDARSFETPPASRAASLSLFRGRGGVRREAQLGRERCNSKGAKRCRAARGSQSGNGV